MTRVEREQQFWDEHVPTLSLLVDSVRRGPDPNVQAMLDAVEPLRGKRVLDFACGAGMTAAFAAQRGALVTGLDISPASLERARELFDQLGLDGEFVCSPLTGGTFPPGSFDAVIGRYALHHTDVAAMSTILGGVLAEGGRGAFVETMGLNPLLRLSRRWLTGVGPVASYGSEDEHPLEDGDLRALAANIGPVSLEVGQMRFLRIFERNVLRGRMPRAGKALGWIDDRLKDLGATRWSYHQVVIVDKVSRPSAVGAASL
jgi:SAM-dependent methyltransferase